MRRWGTWERLENPAKLRIPCFWDGLYEKAGYRWWRVADDGLNQYRKRRPVAVKRPPKRAKGRIAWDCLGL